MVSTTINGLLFDFDGVLSSLMARLGWPYLRALKKAKPNIKRDIVVTTIHKTLEHIFNTQKVSSLYVLQKAYSIGQVKGLNPIQRLKFIIYGLVMYYKSKMIITPFPEVKETLSQLAKNYRLGLVTSAERNVIEKAILQIPILKEFKIIITRENCKNAKPHPEGIIKGIKGLGLTPQECLYIGDLPTDIIAGKRAKVKVVGVLGEFGELAQNYLKSYSPNYLINRIKELPDLLLQINQ